MKTIIYLLIGGLIIVSGCNTLSKKSEKASQTQHLKAILFAEQSPVIDGRATEPVWKQQEWQSLDQNWVGETYSSEDFEGKYKLAWDKNYIYVLAEIKDDTLIDIHPDGLDRYWDDDCLEIFIDEDASGGNHQYNHQAFAYHISLDQRVTDMGLDSTAIYLDSHINSKHRRKGDISTWEVSMKLFDSTFQEAGSNTAATLSEGKKIGFALAYCDNDTSKTRENFIGSEVVEGEDKNRGWIDAGIFREYTLTK